MPVDFRDRAVPGRASGGREMAGICPDKAARRGLALATRGWCGRCSPRCVDDGHGCSSWPGKSSPRFQLRRRQAEGRSRGFPCRSTCSGTTPCRAHRKIDQPVDSTECETLGRTVWPMPGCAGARHAWRRLSNSWGRCQAQRARHLLTTRKRCVPSNSDRYHTLSGIQEGETYATRWKSGCGDRRQ